MIGGIRKWLGRAFISDVSKYLAAPNNVGFSGSLLAKAAHVAHDLNALALDEPISTDLAPIDNSNEDPFDAELRLAFSLGERLSLDFAYRDVARQPRIIPVLEEDNVVRHYQIVRMNSGHGGIAGNILIPHAKTDGQRIYVNFRGTQAHIFSTVHLNLEHCAGEASFHQHFYEIMGQLNTLIGQVSGASNKTVELIFSGHSLGGALSQHAHHAAMSLSTLALCSKLREKSIDISTQEHIISTNNQFWHYLLSKYEINDKKVTLEHFSKVNAFTLNSWGMAGVSDKIERSSNIFADILQANGKKIIGRFGYNTLDIVPKCGEANTLSGCKADVACVVIEDKNLNVARSVASGCIDGVITGTFYGGLYGTVVGATTAIVKGLAPIGLAHNNYHFGPFGEILANKEYTTHRNSTTAGKEAIAKAFDNKLLVLQKSYLVSAKSALQQVGCMGASLKQHVSGTIVSGLRMIYSAAPRLRKA